MLQIRLVVVFLLPGVLFTTGAGFVFGVVEGSIVVLLGTTLGALTIAVIGNGLILMHISPFFTQIVTGAIILVAIWLNTRIFAVRLGPRRKKT